MNHRLDWHKLELSDPRLERDGLRFAAIKSANLGGRGDVLLFVPEQLRKASPVPMAILLHGVYGSSWGWAMKGGAHLTAARLMSAGEIPPMVLAMPSDGLWGDGTGYVAHSGKDYEAWIAHDVPALVRRIVPQTEAGPVFLAGLSMGGYGALRIAAKYGRQHIKAASAMSACTRLEDIFERVTEPASAYVGVSQPTALLDTILANRAKLPALHFNCGTEDSLLEMNRALHRQLQALGLAHAYEEYPGAHTWSYWEKHLEETLRFFARHAGQ
jgi:S-formylglutathione hydrolase FrmB